LRDARDVRNSSPAKVKSQSGAPPSSPFPTSTQRQRLSLHDWWRVIVRVVDRLQTHNSGLLAGGIALYGLLSVFPGLAAAVLIYGLFATPADIERHMSVFAGVLPPGTWEIFKTQLQDIAAHDHGALTVAAGVGLLLALWSARLTMSALMTATTIAYDVPERRGFFLQIFISLLLTLGAVLGFLAMLLVGVVVPVALLILGTDLWVRFSLTIVRWLVLWGFAVVGLALLYYFAPARRPMRWACFSCGSVLTATCWLIVSGLFALYVRFFASYDRTYGALGSVVVLLMWFYLLSYLVVLGAEVNSAVAAIRAARARQSD
jgi:membrane protein